MKKTMKSLIKKVFNDLNWPTLERTSELPVIRVITDVRNRSHLILMPEKQHNKSNDLDYLHELGHATLCEKVHPVFATNGQFAPLVNKRQFLPLLPSLNAASDWFVCHWQQEILPAEMHKQIKDNMPVVEEVLGMPNLPPLDIILDASLLIAQAVHYLDEPIDCDGVLKNIVDAFLTVPPERPSAENCIILVNRLMAAYTDQRARLIPDGNFSVWDVYQPPEDNDVTEATYSQQSIVS
ncbi:MAG: hypothetical protein H7X83_07890 [Verrucomicrobia bacterium]|nr:hypothetical protein [Deltaproteobacteria bacterium]